MIEPTDEMIRDIRARIGGSEVGARSAAEAVLALLERDYDVTPKVAEVEHQMRGDEIRWNHSADLYEAECVCGETFSSWPRSNAEELLLTHLEREARP